MYKSRYCHFLSELLDKKGETERDQSKIITCAALNMIAVALATEGSNHKLTE
jgi:hypothetical protein